MPVAACVLLIPCMVRGTSLRFARLFFKGSQWRPRHIGIFTVTSGGFVFDTTSSRRTRCASSAWTRAWCVRRRLPITSSRIEAMRSCSSIQRTCSRCASGVTTASSSRWRRAAWPEVVTNRVCRSTGTTIGAAMFDQANESGPTRDLTVRLRLRPWPVRLWRSYRAWRAFLGPHRALQAALVTCRAPEKMG
ncbi:MAG: hypothetical protein GAK35_02370 [Herbaspirillum frisingense]|uniref:Uncharacterized protein n=1 Tax=Herbaspirillum frisingense TaxID=92645 RepID=A0A7V8FW82_9BURK|nr:MAG: hypothetical protein GAK35_02370 [Herbaspirillum frisingense]